MPVEVMRTVSAVKPNSATSDRISSSVNAARSESANSFLWYGVASPAYVATIAIQFGFIARPAQVAVKLQSAGRGDANRFGKHARRLRDVMHDAVADHDRKRRRWKRQLLGIGQHQLDSIGQSSRGDVLARDGQHALRRIHRHDANLGHAAAQLDRNLPRAGTKIEDCRAQRFPLWTGRLSDQSARHQ